MATSSSSFPFQNSPRSLKKSSSKNFVQTTAKELAFGVFFAGKRNYLLEKS